jgi:putative ABC transport system permease protein
LTLALGLGSSTLIFSLVNAALLRSLPFPQAERLVVVWFTPPNDANQKFGTNTGAYFILRDNSSVFESLGAARLNEGFNVAPDTENATPDWRAAQMFSTDLIQTIGIKPVLGRWPTADEMAFYNVMISYGLWQRMFAGSPDVIGKKLKLDANIGTVMGVMPRGFQLLRPDVDIWVHQPDANLRNAGRSPNRIFTVIGRLKPGVTIQQAQAELNALAPRVGEELPETHRGWGVKVESLHDAYVAGIRRPLLVFQGAVGIVLLIACANVAGLLLAKAGAREKELALRVALGSARTRIIRQLLTETLLLALSGGLVGIGFAAAGLRAFARVNIMNSPLLDQATLDLRVLVFAGFASFVSCAVFGLLPALQASRPDLMELLHSCVRGTVNGSSPQRIRSAFVVTQIALALVLLIASGLMIRSVQRLNTVQFGFDPGGLMAVQIPFSRSFYHNVPGVQNTPTGGLLVEFDGRFSEVSEAVRQRIAAVPGVESVTAAVTPPLGGVPRRMRFSATNRVIPDQEREVWSAEWYPVSAGYFPTLKVPLLRGRDIDEHDAYSTRPVVVINETMARHFWPNEDPIGQTLQIDMLDDRPREIVGIVGVVRQNRYDRDLQSQMYIPRAQLPHRMDMTTSLGVLVTTFVVRTTADPASMTPPLRAAIHEAAPTQSVSSVTTIEAYAEDQLQELRRYALLLSVFGTMSATLAVIGMFGVMTHVVNQRITEIGIRIALGARPLEILRLVFRRAFVLVLAGVTVGVGLAVIATRLIGGFLWGITATDPATFAAVSGLLSGIGLLACYLPARRALKADPVLALRDEAAAKV